MATVLAVMSDIMVTLLSALMFLLLIRAVLSMLAPDSDHPLVNIVFNVTDVVMAPARVLLDKTGWFQNSMFDMSYFITVIFLWILSALFIYL